MPVPSPAGRVCVNDDLTRETSRVAARARQLKRDEKIMDTWARDGEIYVKKNDGSIDNPVYKPLVGCVVVAFKLFNINIPVVAKYI